MDKIKIGDKIAYSVQFLKAIGKSHSDMARAKGVVLGIMPLGERSLISIDWDCDMPVKVLCTNLAHIGPNSKYCQC